MKNCVKEDFDKKEQKDQKTFRKIFKIKWLFDIFLWPKHYFWRSSIIGPRSIKTPIEFCFVFKSPCSISSLTQRIPSKEGLLKISGSKKTFKKSSVHRRALCLRSKEDLLKFLISHKTLKRISISGRTKEGLRRMKTFKRPSFD